MSLNVDLQKKAAFIVARIGRDTQAVLPGSDTADDANGGLGDGNEKEALLNEVINNVADTRRKLQLQQVYIVPK